MEYLNYQRGDRFAPIPLQERDLQTVVAEPFQTICYEEGTETGGLCFDRDLHMYYSMVSTGSVYKLDMSNFETTEIYKKAGHKTGAIKLHRDGRCFVCCMEDDNGDSGLIFSVNSDGSEYREVLTEYSVGDMVFDSIGGLYFTDTRGKLDSPTGGVYYVSPDSNEVIPIIESLAAPRGIALSTDEAILWVTETLTGRIYRIPLKETKRFRQVYQIEGCFGPVSCSVDIEDNLYVSVYGQGRVLIFNKNGFPIGQILLPGREEGKNLLCTDVLVCPGTRSVYILSSDDDGEGSLFRIGSFAEGNTNAFQFKQD